MHIPARICINYNAESLYQDYELWLEKPAPEKPYSQYKHNRYEDNEMYI